MLLFSKKSNIYFFKQVCQIKELSYRNCKPSFKVYKVKRQAFIL